MHPAAVPNRLHGIVINKYLQRVTCPGYVVPSLWLRASMALFGQSIASGNTILQKAT